MGAAGARILVPGACLGIAAVRWRRRARLRRVHLAAAVSCSRPAACWWRVASCSPICRRRRRAAAAASPVLGIRLATAGVATALGLSSCSCTLRRVR